ncbi:redoxin domain-containing protein [Candidatus Neomarinimicrobiota bacterium]
MRKAAQVISILLLLANVGFSAELELGSAIPLADAKMQDISGERISLNDVMQENGLVVIFSCNTCPWVHAWEDRYVELAEAYQEKGVGFVAINSNAAYREKGDGLGDMQVRAKEKGYNFYYTLDKNSQLAKAFGATRTPHVFVFNTDGKLIYRGAIDDNAKNPEKVEDAYLAAALDASLAGKVIKAASTKALGCTIKFAD